MRALSRLLHGRKPIALLLLGAFALASPLATAQDSFQASGFAWLRGSEAEGTRVLDHEDLSIQLQTGLDWYVSPRTRAHLHLLVRDDRDRSEDENFGIVEGFVETHLSPLGDRLRLRAGAFFLPTSREHVDALWETPYAITASALNGWLGEELRPIGIDADYSRGSVQLGATIFGGNDAFGTLPAVRGWALRDHVALIDETITAEEGALSRISVDTDDRPGLSARLRWNDPRGLLQYTWIDNRASGDQRGGVDPWRTPFHILSGEYWLGEWTVAAETGWGYSWIPGLEQVTTTDLRASYILVSRRLAQGRATIRADELTIEDDTDLAVTLAWLWRPHARIKTGLELTTLEGDIRAMAEIRTYFSLPAAARAARN